MPTLEIITPPAEPLVSLAELKRFLRVAPDWTDDDDLILALAGTAVELIEGRYGISLGPTAYRETRVMEDSEGWRPLRGPLVEVLSVTVDGEQLAPLPDGYAYGTEGQSVVVEYTAGGSDASETAKTVVKLICSVLYDNRGAGMEQIPPFIWHLANRLSIGREVIR